MAEMTSERGRRRDRSNWAEHGARKPEGRTVEEVSGRGCRVFADGKTEAEEDKRQMIHPARANARGQNTGHETFFERPVLTFDHAI